MRPDLVPPRFAGHALAALILVLPTLVSCCGPAAPVAETGMGVASVASIPVFPPAPIDLVGSAPSERDCAKPNLGIGDGYCGPREMQPGAPEFCTRSLGVVDCWKNPWMLPDHPRGVADGPRALTPEQEAVRNRYVPAPVQPFSF